MARSLSQNRRLGIPKRYISPSAHSALLSISSSSIQSPRYSINLYSPSKRESVTRSIMPTGRDVNSESAHWHAAFPQPRIRQPARFSRMVPANYLLFPPLKLDTHRSICVRIKLSESETVVMCMVGSLWAATHRWFITANQTRVVTSFCN